MLINLRTDKRGYTLSVQRDLLGDVVLMRRWFGLTNRRGGFKQDVFRSEEAALRRADRLMQVRLSHGYRQDSG